MKIAVARFADATERLVEVDGDVVREIEGATPNDLITVCMDPKSWTARAEKAEVSEVSFLPPLARPVSLRDFMAYEDHIKNSMNGLGQQVNPAWYDAPVFFFQNPNVIIGDGDTIRRPKGSQRLDYELEVAAIIGREVRDVDSDDPHALDCIAGFTFMNDWSARDLAAKEMRHFMGPVKGKDFGTSLGPWVVTRDEVGGLPDGVIDEDVAVKVNGKVTTSNNIAGMYFKWPEIIARASENTPLVPGDVIGSGTVGFGCLLELRTKDKQAYDWLQDGDVVELQSTRFGTLTNVVSS